MNDTEKRLTAQVKLTKELHRSYLAAQAESNKAMQKWKASAATLEDMV